MILLGQALPGHLFWRLWWREERTARHEATLARTPPVLGAETCQALPCFQHIVDLRHVNPLHPDPRASVGEGPQTNR